MKIYLDYIFFENLIINIILTLQISFFTKTKMKKINVIIASIFLSIYTTIAYFTKDGIVNEIYIKLIIILIYVYIAFFPKTISEYIKKTIYYFLIYFMYVGIIISISLIFKINLSIGYMKILIYIISGVFLYVFNRYLWKMWKNNIKNDNLTYTISIEGQEINSFVDTGNSVKDIISDLDVIFIDSEYFNKINKSNYIKKVELNFNTISNQNNLDGYIVKDLLVYKNKKLVTKINKIVLCFIEKELSNKKYSALIGYNTYVENLKGVTLC